MTTRTESGRMESGRANPGSSTGLGVLASSESATPIALKSAARQKKACPSWARLTTFIRTGSRRLGFEPVTQDLVLESLPGESELSSGPGFVPCMLRQRIDHQTPLRVLDRGFEVRVVVAVSGLPL